MQQGPDRLIKPLQLLQRGGATTQHQVDRGLLDVEQGGQLIEGESGEIELLQSHGVHDNPLDPAGQQQLDKRFHFEPYQQSLLHLG